MLHEAINKTEQAAKNIFKVHVPLNLCLVQANTEIYKGKPCKKTTRENAFVLKLQGKTLVFVIFQI